MEMSNYHALEPGESFSGQERKVTEDGYDTLDELPLEGIKKNSQAGGRRRRRATRRHRKQKRRSTHHRKQKRLQ